MKLPVRQHPPRRNRGSALIEAAVSIGLLGFMAMLLMRSSMNSLTGRNWTMVQNLTDAYLTYEVALAERVPFDRLTANDSLWPVNPTRATSTVVVGRLPGASNLSATLYRTRVAYSNNLSASGGTGTATTNPAGLETWKLESVLVYTVGNSTYRKIRTVLRTR